MFTICYGGDLGHLQRRIEPNRTWQVGLLKSILRTVRRTQRERRLVEPISDFSLHLSKLLTPSSPSSVEFFYSLGSNHVGESNCEIFPLGSVYLVLKPTSTPFIFPHDSVWQHTGDALSDTLADRLVKPSLTW
jgi:hypothetical protein